MKKILIDTNAYSRLLAGNKKIFDVIGSAETIYMSIFVLGELYAGFAGGTKNMENKETLYSFLAKPTVKILNATSETAELFGLLKNSLSKVGTPIPINDVWIAAHAIETGSSVITFDIHFNKVAGLRLWDGI
jgi:tRNA(fMet)-specific endonuclease VapC